MSFDLFISILCANILCVNWALNTSESLPAEQSSFSKYNEDLKTAFVPFSDYQNPRRCQILWKVFQNNCSKIPQSL